MGRHSGTGFRLARIGARRHAAGDLAAHRDRDVRDHRRHRRPASDRRTRRRFFRLFGNRPSELEAKHLLLMLFGFGALAAWAESEAVLPAYVIGMVLAGTVGKDRALVRRLRTVTFGLLTPFYFIRAGSFVSVPALLAAPLAFLLLLGAKGDGGTACEGRFGGRNVRHGCRRGPSGRADRHIRGGEQDRPYRRGSWRAHVLRALADRLGCAPGDRPCTARRDGRSTRGDDAKPDEL